MPSSSLPKPVGRDRLPRTWCVDTARTRQGRPLDLETQVASARPASTRWHVKCSNGPRPRQAARSIDDTGPLTRFLALSRFSMQRPPHEIEQDRALTWLTAAHVASEGALHSLGDRERDAFAARIQSAMDRCACGPRSIGSRGHALPDIGRTDWESLDIYDVVRHPRGKGASARAEFFRKVRDGVLRARIRARNVCAGRLDSRLVHGLRGAERRAAARREPRLGDARDPRLSHGLLRRDAGAADRCRDGDSARGASTSCTPSCARCTSIRPTIGSSSSSCRAYLTVYSILAQP